MSKIPQGEWNAIAARYAQGESISRIAQSYGCTPPAIHYILKRNKQRAVHKPSQAPLALPENAPAPVQSGPSPSGGGAELQRTCSGSSEVRGAPRPPQLRPGPDRQMPPARPMPSERISPRFSPEQPAPVPLNSGRDSAFTAGLNSELQGRAEAAVAAFLSSFDAALTEGSPHLRKQLRDAATDLMRVAARTTIVLDRLNASAEHASKRGD